MPLTLRITQRGVFYKAGKDKEERELAVGDEVKVEGDAIPDLFVGKVMVVGSAEDKSLASAKEAKEVKAENEDLKGKLAAAEKALAEALAVSAQLQKQLGTKP